MKNEYYITIPHDIRINKNLSSLSKLIYGEILILSNRSGYCFASNKYLAEIYGKTIKTISKNISELVENDFIETEIIKENKMVKQRKIKIKQYKQKCSHVLTKTSIGYEQKCSGGMNKNVKDNITSINITSNNITNTQNTITFEWFWNTYNKKIDRMKSEKKWNKLTDEEKQKIYNTLPNYLKTIKDKQYQKYPSTYLNNKCWLDEIETNQRKLNYV